METAAIRQLIGFSVRFAVRRWTKRMLTRIRTISHCVLSVYWSFIRYDAKFCSWFIGKELNLWDVDKSKVKRKRSARAPLIRAAERVSKLICELSADRELFVTDNDKRSEKKLDTKALKEFSGVIKEMSAVIAELDPVEGARECEGILIEFGSDAEELSG